LKYFGNDDEAKKNRVFRHDLWRGQEYVSGSEPIVHSRHLRPMCRRFSTKETLNDILNVQNPVDAENSVGSIGAVEAKESQRTEPWYRHNVETDIVLFVSQHPSWYTAILGHLTHCVPRCRTFIGIPIETDRGWQKPLSEVPTNTCSWN
jgi:hypothetical protein